MKLKNIFCYFITIFCMLFVATIKADATAPNSYNVNGKDIYEIKSSKYLPNGGFDGYGFHFKKNANGDIIYCVESHDYAVTSGTMKYTLSKELEAKYAYVIANGYPNKSITGNAEKDYFITGLAIFNLVNPNDTIFKFFDLNKGTYRGSASDVVVEMAKLVNGAKKYSYTNPSITLNTNNNFAISSDKKYYISSNMNVSTTGNVGNYTVSLENAPAGTFITDSKGNKKNSFSTSESFKVYIPVNNIKNLSNTFKVKVTSTGTIYKAYLYEASNSSYQNTAALYPVNNTISKENSVKLELTPKVIISKIDATTSKELPGATLTIKNSKGEVVKTWVSTNEPMIIENLPAGKYTLTEKIAPEGYVLSTETISFEVKLDGTITKVEMKNKLTEVQISKVDITNGKELPGATLTIKNSKGEEVKTWVSSNKPEVIKGLPVGKYTLTEKIAPEGYILSTKTVSFEVKSDGTVTKVKMENKPKEKTPIYISKQDITTKEELPGAHLELRDEKGKLVEAWVSTNIPHVIEKLEPGKYFLTEVLAPEGYELSTETVEFTVNKDGTVDGDIIMYNDVETIEVPNTASFKNITTSLIGIIVITFGAMIIYRNYKKNEEY